MTSKVNTGFRGRVSGEGQGRRQITKDGISLPVIGKRERPYFAKRNQKLTAVRFRG